jgi:hypothetical protein
MFKKYSIIDVTFFIFTWIFVLLGIYELIMFIIPRYSFTRASALFIVSTLLYVWYKSNFNAEKIKNIFQKKSPKKIELLENIDSKQFDLKAKIDFIRKNRDYIAYSSFIAMCLIILISMFMDTGEIFKWSLVLFSWVFLILKLIGFKLKTQVRKSNLSSWNTVRFFLMSFALFFIVMKIICDNFDIVESERLVLYIGFSLVYLVGGFIIFFRYTLKFSWLFRPYNILSALLVLSLLWVLGYKNGLWDAIKEKYFPQEIPEEIVIVEDMDLPWIISDEVEISEEEVVAEYEKVLVSSVYDIQDGLTLGSVWQSVSDLQTVLGNLQYFIWEVSGNFDEDTRLALVDTLKWECAWPESTSGIFGPQAKECIDSLEISIIKQ